MKKTILFTLMIFTFNTLLKSQDIIIFKDGTEIESKVLKVGKTEITYKKYSNLNGPEYTEEINNIFMIKYEGGGKDVFNNNTTNENKENLEEELVTIQSGELITLFFKESLNSKELSNGQLIRLAVKDDVVSNNGKIIIAANTPVNGRITNVKNAKWAGQKGKISLQINNINAVDGTSIPVFYNLNNEGKSRQSTAVGVGMLLFWPALFLKGKEANIDAGTLILVETLGSTTLNTANFKIRTRNPVGDNLNNIPSTIEDETEDSNPCGEEPEEPINTFNKYQFHLSKEYKAYKKKLKEWKECVGE